MTWLMANMPAETYTMLTGVCVSISLKLHLLHHMKNILRHSSIKIKYCYSSIFSLWSENTIHSLGEIQHKKGVTFLRLSWSGVFSKIEVGSILLLRKTKLRSSLTFWNLWNHVRRRQYWRQYIIKHQVAVKDSSAGHSQNVTEAEQDNHLLITISYEHLIKFTIDNLLQNNTYRFIIYIQIHVWPFVCLFKRGTGNSMT